MIRGKVVQLRPIENEDQAYLLELGHDPVVRANVVGWEFPRSLHEQQRWFATSVQSSTHRWIVLDSSGRRIGLTGLWDIDWHNRSAKTALKIGGKEAQRGRGFGTDAIKTVMAFAFYDVGLERLYSTILASNEASLRVYTEKCGWQVEGTARKHVWRHGRRLDVVHIGALPEDFDALGDSRWYQDRVSNNAV